MPTWYISHPPVCIGLAYGLAIWQDAIARERMMVAPSSVPKKESLGPTVGTSANNLAICQEDRGNIVDPFRAGGCV